MKVIKKIRALNRNRNRLKKELKYKINLYKATKLWPHNKNDNISPSEIRTVLLIRNDGKIGDAIVSTCIIKAMHEVGIKIDILAVKGNEFVFSANPYVRNVYLSGEIANDDIYDHGISDALIDVIKSNNYDLLIDTGIWDTGLYMPRMIKEISPKSVLGFNKPKWVHHYNINIMFNHYECHVKEIYSSVMSFLNPSRSTCQRYEVYYPDSILKEVKALPFFSNGKNKVIINMYASHNDRNLTPEQTSGIISGLFSRYNNVDLIVLDYKKIFKSDFFEGATVYHVPSLYHAMAAISLSDLVISPDTAIVHVSAMYDVPLIGIYRHIPENNILWSPGYDNGHQVFSSEFIVGKDSSLVDKVLKKVHEVEVIN